MPRKKKRTVSFHLTEAAKLRGSPGGNYGNMRSVLNDTHPRPHIEDKENKAHLLGQCAMLDRNTPTRRTQKRSYWRALGRHRENQEHANPGRNVRHTKQTVLTGFRLEKGGDSFTRGIHKPVGFIATLETEPVEKEISKTECQIRKKKRKKTQTKTKYDRANNHMSRRIPEKKP